MKSTRVSFRREKKKNEVGTNVRSVRLSLRPQCSQEDLSGRLAKQGLKLDRSAIARIEIGDRYVMDYELLALAKALRVSVRTLLVE